ncbi:MAG TPA: purine/pyrimidine permease, partial [Dissulfurispiraceae bacterium]|nr:purine/pyrimidine permease [Dissulfurispiraceae bacterium]
DIGSMQALVPLLNPPDMHRRVTRGLTVTGLMNIAAGGLGVVGPVNFSLSPGLIATLGCASRYAFIPAALMLLIISFSPVLLGIASAIPQTVIGGILVFSLSSQVGAGLSAAYDKKKPRFEDGLTIGFSLLAGTIVSLLPQIVIQEIPVLLRPVLGNGFVVGIVTVLIFDHLIFADKSV